MRGMYTRLTLFLFIAVSFFRVVSRPECLCGSVPRFGFAIRHHTVGPRRDCGREIRVGELEFVTRHYRINPPLNPPQP